MVEVAESYEMVRNFNNFKAFVMFAVKNWKPCLSWSENVADMLMSVRKIFYDYAYISQENFFDLFPSPPPPPPRRQHFRGEIVRLGQNPRKCWSKHDDTPQC
jgi:hypothetical protein